MSLELMIYLAGVVDKLSDLMCFLQATSILVAIILAIAAMVRADYYSDETVCDYLKIHFNKAISTVLLLMFTISSVMVTILPSEKTIYLIAATTISKDIVQSKGVQTLYDKTFKLLEGKLDEQIKLIDKKN